MYKTFSKLIINSLYGGFGMDEKNYESFICFSDKEAEKINEKFVAGGIRTHGTASAAHALPSSADHSPDPKRTSRKCTILRPSWPLATRPSTAQPRVPYGSARGSRASDHPARSAQRRQ